MEVRIKGLKGSKSLSQSSQEFDESLQRLRFKNFSKLRRSSKSVSRTKYQKSRTILIFPSKSIPQNSRFLHFPTWNVHDVSVPSSNPKFFRLRSNSERFLSPSNESPMNRLVGSCRIWSLSMPVRIGEGPLGNFLTTAAVQRGNNLQARGGSKPRFVTFLS